MPELDWETTVSRIYRESVAQHAEDGIERQVAYDTAQGRIHRLLDSGALRMPVDAAIRAALDRADDKDARRADTVLRRILSGQSLIAEEGDPLLDVVVKLGKGQRKAWRHVTANDVQSMTELRGQNVAAAVTSFEDWKADADAAFAALTIYGSIGAAVSAGAFTAHAARAS